MFYLKWKISNVQSIHSSHLCSDGVFSVLSMTEATGLLLLREYLYILWMKGWNWMGRNFSSATTFSVSTTLALKPELPVQSGSQEEKQIWPNSELPGREVVRDWSLLKWKHTEGPKRIEFDSLENIACYIFNCCLQTLYSTRQVIYVSVVNY